jgi:hypothetical protein
MSWLFTIIGRIAKHQPTVTPQVDSIKRTHKPSRLREAFTLFEGTRTLRS